MVRTRHVIVQVLFVLVLLGLWQWTFVYFHIDPALFSPASAVLERALQMLFRADVLAHLWITLRTMFAAFGVGATLGLLVGVWLANNRFAQETLDPFLMGLFAMPKIIFFPLFILWFGLGTANKVAFGAYHGFFPVVINTIAGVRELQGKYVLAARAMGVSRFQLFRYVIFPSIVPLLFTGFRVGLNLTFVGVVISELLVVKQGAGALIQKAAASLKMADLLAVTLLVGLMAFLLNQMLLVIERRLSRWRQAGAAVE